MNGNWSTVKSKLDLFPDYQSTVFEQGYLITNRDIKMDDGFPYFGNWRKYQWNNLHFYLHQHQKLFVHEEAGRLYFLIGHAYDPFAVISEESQILKRYAAVSCGDFVKGLPCVYDMTGLFLMGFTDGEHVTFWGDFESMRTTYYGKIGSHWYISSHEELVAFQEPLTPDPYVDRLESYRFYHLYGEGLPSDISHYFELKKLICNNFVNYEDGCFKTRRFFPRGPLKMCGSEEEYRQTVEKIAQIMRTSLEMTVKKWPRAAVSVTGGRDSKGSLAASVHIKDQLQYFSYELISSCSFLSFHDMRITLRLEGIKFVCGFNPVRRDCYLTAHKLRFSYCQKPSFICHPFKGRAVQRLVITCYGLCSAVQPHIARLAVVDAMGRCNSDKLISLIIFSFYVLENRILSIHIHL